MGVMGVQCERWKGVATAGVNGMCTQPAAESVCVRQGCGASCFSKASRRSLRLGVGFQGRNSRSQRRNWRAGVVLAPFSASPVAVAENSHVGVSLLRPSPAEAARTIVEICSEGTLSTMSEDEWPSATAVRFAVDLNGNPVFRFSQSSLHVRHLALDNRSSLHVQLEQPGRQKPHCTLRGRIVSADSKDLEKNLDSTWERRFGKEEGSQGDIYYIMIVEQVLQAQDMGEEETRVSGPEYTIAAADPLRECAPRIVDDMNRKHWEDIRRFCNIYAKLDAQVEEASMTWVDRLGFDLRVRTQSPQTLLEIRIPYPREVTDERDARSSLTMMAQIAWEQERNYSPPEVQFLANFNIS